MAKKQKKALDALIFVDTNILLDFYRIRGGGVGLELLDLIDKHKNVIITGTQVEMEYKRNRQRAILEGLNSIKTPDWSGLTPPAFLASAKPSKNIEKSKKDIATQQGKLKKRIVKILDNPTLTDPVFKTLQRLFKNSSPYNLHRPKKERFHIRNLARKRFGLGYPPRKPNDTSMGDAINWEWIIDCAIRSGKDIVLVSRDQDYGFCIGDRFYLNDWLRHEFMARVSRKRKIVLTDRLGEAFKLTSIRVSAAAVREEKELVSEPILPIAAPQLGASVTSFASELRVPPPILLEQLAAAGVAKSGSDALLTEYDKVALLKYLRRSHGLRAPAVVLGKT